MFLNVSCNTPNNTPKSIFPEKINGYTKKSEGTIKNKQKINLYQNYNENNNLIEIATAFYGKKTNTDSKHSFSGDYFIKRYKYKDSLSALSEFTLSKDSAYDKFDKSQYAYMLGNSVIILSGIYIYVISTELCNLNLLKVKPFTNIKLPESPISKTYLNLKLFINDTASFPFFKTYIQRKVLYKDTILTIITPFNPVQNEINKLETFIKKQNILEETLKYILFKIKNENNLFLWNKEKKILFSDFEDDDLKIIKNI